MNMISFSQFDNSTAFSGESSDPHDKEEINGEFSALLSSFYVPPPPLAALPASLSSPDSTGVSEIAAGDSQNPSPLGGQINFAPANLPVADSFFAKLPNQAASLPETLLSEINQPGKIKGQGVPALVKTIDQNVSAPDSLWSGKVLPPNPKSDQTSEINVRLPVLGKASETSVDQPVSQNYPATDHVGSNKDLPPNPQNKDHFAVIPNDQAILPEKLQVENIQSVKTINKGFSGGDNFWADKTLSPSAKSEAGWRIETKIQAKNSIGLPTGLAKIFQTLAAEPVEKPVALNFLSQYLNQTEKGDSAATETKTDKTFSLEDLINQETSPIAAQHLQVEKTSAESPESELEQTSPVTQISDAINELSSKIAQSREPQLIKLRLRPAELGTVEVRIEQNSDGKINAHLTTHLESTKQIFTENIAELRHSLQQAGWRVEHLEISCDSSSANANLSSNNNQSEAQQTPMQQSGISTQNSSLHSETENSNSPDLTVERNNNRLLSVRA